MQKTYRTVKKRSLFRRFINNSITVSILTYFSARLHSLLSKGILADFFASSDSLDSAKNSGLLSIAAGSIHVGAVFSVIRHNFAKSVENSRIIKLYRILIKAFFCSSVRSFGVFLLSSGLYSMLSYALKLYMTGGAARTHADALTVALMVLVSLFLLFSKKSIGRKISEGTLLSLLLFDLLGINRLAIDKDSFPADHFPAAFFGGLAYGVAVFFLSPVRALLYAGTAVILLIIIYSPESGLLATMAAIPFGSEKVLFFILLSTLISYVLKLLRGKRNLTFKSEDIPAIFFAFIFALAFPVSGTLKTLFSVSSYFMASNLMRNISLLKKSAYCVSLGLFVNMLIQSVLFISDKTGTSSTLLAGFALENYRNGSGFMIAAAIPFSLYLFCESDSGFNVIFRLLFVVSSLFNACVFLSDEVWLFSIICIFIYLVYRTAKFFNVLFGFVLTIPIIYYIREGVSVYNYIKPFKTVGIINRLPGILPLLFGGADAGGALYGKLIESFGILGCFLGIIFLTMLLARSFTSSSLSRDDSMRNLCAVCITGILVFFLFGLSENTLDSENRILLFWTLCGLVSATGNAVARFASDEDFS